MTPKEKNPVNGVKAGYYDSLGITVAGGIFGFVFGVLAEHTGLSIYDGVLMSAGVYAGAAQMISLQLWHHPLPTFTLVSIAFIVCFRYVLMGFALRPKLRGIAAHKVYPILFFMADENWALTMIKSNTHQATFLYGYLFASGVAFYLSWVSFTLIGMLAGQFIDDPKAWGLDFAFLAIFLALQVGLWKSKQDMLPWSVAAIIAIVAAKIIPGNYFIIIGALSGSFLAVVRDYYASK